MTSLLLTCLIEPFGPAGAIVLSDDQVAELGGGRRAAVNVRIADRSARLRLAVMGGANLIGLSKSSREQLGVSLGERVTAEITLDEAPREVDVPQELAATLAQDPAAAEAFATLPYTARKEFASWVAGAKRTETRQRRLADAITMLREGRRLS